MRRLDMGTVIICAVMAMVGTIGTVVGTAAFFGIQFQKYDSRVLVGICGVLGIVIWGILLIFISNTSVRRAEI